MRISIEETDPGYSELARFSDIKVFCDNVEVKLCITADTDTGYVRYRSKLPPQEGVWQEKYGKVVIVGDLSIFS